MNLRWRTRTSLFARMSLLFGLLVTVPLVISGIVLSLAGHRVIHDSGNEVAAVGSDTVKKTSETFRDVAERQLKQAAKSVADYGTDRLKETSKEAVMAGKAAFKDSTDRLKKSGAQAVETATDSMVEVANESLGKSLEDLRELNRESLRLLSKDFSTRMQSELAVSSDPVQESLRKSLLSTWELSADRRSISVKDYAARVASQILLRLELPFRLSVVQASHEKDQERIKQYLESYIRKGFMPEIVRVVHVSKTGTELVRVPDSDLKPGEDGEDWADAPTRKALIAQQDTLLEEPVRYDERSKRWIKRIAQKLVSTSPEPTPAAAEQAMIGGEPVPQPPPPFVVVDYSVESLAELAAGAMAPRGMQVLVIQANTGRVISSFPRLGDAIAQRILEKLPSGDEAVPYESKQLTFSYTTGDQTPMRGTARFWGARERLWTVVVQSESDVFQPVSELKEGIQSAWGGALTKVNQDTGARIEARNNEAEKIRHSLIGQARASMEKASRSEVVKVGQALNREQDRVVKKLDADLNTAAEKLHGTAAAGLDSKAEKLAEDAVGNFEERARLATDMAATQIQERSRQVANRAAGQMLLNSAWLIPLFLVLALFLATLTARSLVRPINQLVKGTQALAAGEYGQRIKVQGDDELARLAGAFNTMAGAIQAGQAELQQSHDSLVAEKTRIEGIVDSTPDGLVMLEKDGRVALINPTALRLLDLSPAAIPPVPFEISQLPGPAAQRLQECLDLAHSGEGVQQYDIAEPERRVLQLREVRLQSHEGRSYGRLLHLHDITREKVIDEMKSDFISLVSHELRTPLTSILGFSSYMLTGRMGEVTETQRTALDSIHRQARRLSAIISDFLDVSRIESGKIEMKKEPVAVPSIAKRVVEDLRPQANEKSIRVSANVEDSPLSLTALGDEQRIAQVFTNLVGNALKFTDPGGSVDVVLSRQNGELLCKVRDSGCGIPPDELERVFDRFYQVEKVVTRKSGGTGLGLAIVKNIVEAHGGRIWLDSQVGKGTEVSFTLPGADD
jgi:signal transduction histidine kinase